MSQLSKSNNSNKTERIIQDWYPEDNKFWLQTGKKLQPAIYGSPFHVYY